MNLNELDPVVVHKVINTMIEINNMGILGLMKYKIIERDESNLYRVMEEYKIHLDIIEPVKYFEDSGPFEVLNKVLMILSILTGKKSFHSDLKPSNIFLNDENEVIINDYCNNLLYKGREGSRNRKLDDLCFVCIDELLGKELDISSDIWNFGLIFYYVVSGNYPFLGRNKRETLENIENVIYTPLEGEYGDKFNTFLRIILVKEKEDRLKLNEIIDEMKKLNVAELPVIPFEEEEESQIPTPFTSLGEEKYILERKIDEKINEYDNENDELSFSNLKMGDEGMMYLCIKFDLMDNVTTIQMNANDLTIIGLNRFSECLKFFPNLDWLNLNNNQIGKNGLKLFSENLHFIPKLNRLELGECGLGCDDMKYLSSHFKEISNLEVLNIGVNEISNDGVKYLCENINKIPNLSELYLHENKIDDYGGEILINNLHKCNKLERLNVKNNIFTSYPDFERRMKENHPNKELDVLGNTY